MTATVIILPVVKNDHECLAAQRALAQSWLNANAEESPPSSQPRLIIDNTHSLNVIPFRRIPIQSETQLPCDVN